MAVSDKPPRNGFVRVMRKVYNPIGFSKGYNALLWFIFDGALLGFVLARISYLSFYGTFCNPDLAKSATLHAAPGECYYYLGFDRYRIGIQIHLYTIIPAGLLAVMQFIPVIRYKALIVHRMFGYIAALLVVLANASAIVIVDKAFGGGASVQGFVGLVGIITTLGLVLAIYNVKKLQIDQHRKWMLRTWFYMSSIITLRIILAIAGAITANWPSQAQHVAMDCDKLVNIFQEAGNSTGAFAAYPACDPSNPFYTPGSSYAVVQAKLLSPNPAQRAAATDAFFGMAAWLAFALHAIGVEIYLHLTPAEHDRLRQVSYEKQLERGWKNAGYSGLVVEKFGDVTTPWKPAVRGPKREGSDDTMDFTHGEQTTLPK